MPTSFFKWAGMVKNLPASAGDARDAGLIPGWGRSPGEENGSPVQYSCWKITWTGEPGGLQSVESQRVGHNWATARTHTYVYQHLKITLMVLLSWNWIMDCSFLYFFWPCIASVIKTWKNYKNQCHWDSFQLPLPLIFPFCSLSPQEDSRLTRTISAGHY